ncbi:CAAD domain-containing protein [Cyanobium sp. FGCU-52]|nr:CAAD domain-containing protein [Cyanobium sp. FGCU52]
MADVPENPVSPNPLEAAEAQDPSPVTPADEPEVAAAAVEPAVEPPVVTETDVEMTEAVAPSEEPEPAAWTAPVAEEPTTTVPDPVAAPPEPEPEPAPAAPAPAAPSIAATLEAPPLSAAGGGGGAEEGGEWDLLMSKLRDFLDGGSLQAWWERLGGPLRGAGLLIGLVLVLRLYGALLDTLDDLPLVPRLLQLAGLITLVRFALTRLVRTEERQAVLNDWKGRWQRFRGSP